jgi:hypothetical protein
MWQTKPSADVNVNLSLRDLVLGSLRLEEAEKGGKSGDPKLIEHEPVSDKSE